MNNNMINNLNFIPNMNMIGDINNNMNLNLNMIPNFNNNMDLMQQQMMGQQMIQQKILEEMNGIKEKEIELIKNYFYSKLYEIDFKRIKKF